MLLVVVTLVVYLPVWDAEFILYDDNVYITENRHVVGGLDYDNAVWALTAGYASTWQPLVWLSYMLEAELYGLDPAIFHRTNLFLHFANTVVLFLVLCRLSGCRRRSLLVAALFALHPLHVEPVAWIASRKDLLSTLFMLLALWCYAGYVRRPCLMRFVPVLLLFAVGLAAKPMLVTFPFVLLLLDVWPLNRICIGSDFRSLDRRVIYEKIPLVIFAAGSCVTAYYVQHHGGAIGDFDVYPLKVRCATALVSYGFYLFKTIWPVSLAVFYPHPGMPAAWQVLLSVLLLCGISFIAVRAARRSPALLVGWLWYLGTLVPVIGLVQFGSHARADRFTYVPLIGVFIALIWILPERVFLKRRIKFACVCLCITVIAAFSFLSREQALCWQNSEKLFRHALNVTDDNYIMHGNLGVVMIGQGRFGEAALHLREALRIEPDYEKAHSNLGMVLARSGRLQEAIVHFQAAVRIRPDYDVAYNNLGAALMQQGHLNEARELFRKALDLKPDYADACRNLGLAQDGLGNRRDALRLLLQALRLKPDPQTHFITGMLYERQGNLTAARRQYASARRLQPDHAPAIEGLKRLSAF